MMRKATLIIDDKAIELPILEATLGENVIDVRALTSEGYFTYDPGFISTAACSSKITFIDGKNGVLLHRGYPIEQLAYKADFMEVSHLLLQGDLPTESEKAAFELAIKKEALVNEKLTNMMAAFHHDAHPMAMLSSLVSGLAAYHHEGFDINNENHRDQAAIRLIAKIPTLSAMIYKHSIGEPMVYPRNELGYAENFLHMMFSTPSEDYVINPVIAKAMDLIFILHADHEQNASTSTVRLSGSSGANVYACVSAGISTLWGPAHGGANEAVLKMLDEIGDVSNISAYIEKSKDKSDPFKLMGFGHRVYRNFDPRAKIMKEACDAVLADIGLSDPQLAIAKELEKIALEDPYFVERKLYPNVDFYSGIILKAIGIPTSMFTVIFALARTVGWATHWNEFHSEPNKIGRPRQLYTGPGKRDI
jgi:citrate synthase